MTNRANYAPQDFQKMCKQAERDHEAKKLMELMQRVERQIAERENPGLTREGGTPSGISAGESRASRRPSRSVPFER